MQLLGRQQRKAVGEVEAHLRPEMGQRTGLGAVHLLDARLEDQPHQVEILAHRAPSLDAARTGTRGRVTSVLAPPRTRFRWLPRIAAPNHLMRYQRAEFPLKLEGREAARNSFAGCFPDADPSTEALCVSQGGGQAR